MKGMTRKTKISIFVTCAIVLFLTMNVLVFSLIGYWSKKMKAEGLCQMIEDYMKNDDDFSEKFGDIIAVFPDRKNLRKLDQISSNEYSIYCGIETNRGSTLFVKLNVIFESDSNEIQNIIMDTSDLPMATKVEETS